MAVQSEAERIAKGLSRSQKAYLLACAASPEPYLPRHGSTANWALRHKYADTILRLNDGREGPWDSFDISDRTKVGIDVFLGERLTDLGLAIRAILLRDQG